MCVHSSHLYFFGVISQGRGGVPAHSLLRGGGGGLCSTSVRSWRSAASTAADTSATGGPLPLQLVTLSSTPSGLSR